MAEVEQQQEVAQPQQEELSEIKQLARQGKTKDAGGGAVFCYVCEKKSYPAETISFEKIPYHKQCFSCTKCNKKIEGGFNAAMFEYNLYCRGCFQTSGFNRLQAQVKWTPKASGSNSTYNPAFAHLGGGAKVCKVCEKDVFSAEGVLFEKETYHPSCMSCSECSVGLTVANANKFQEKLFCPTCWKNGNYAKKQLELANTGPKASGQYSAVTLKLGGGGNPCHACQKTVYPAEQLTFEKKIFHQNCLQCVECNLKLTLSQANQFEDCIYCTKCWQNGGYAIKQRDAAKNWTAKEGADAAAYNPVAAKLGSNSGTNNKCRTCEKTVYPAETLLYEGHNYHPICFKCTHCDKRIENINQAQHNKKNPYHNRCFVELNLHRPENA